MCSEAHRRISGAALAVALGPALGSALALSFCVALPATAQTGTQVVTASPAAISVEPGGALSMDVLYDTTPRNATLTGLGISMHWDSTKLADPEISSFLGTALIGQQILDDPTDLDGDPATDRRALLAWLDVSGNWPGTLPTKLYTATFASGVGLTAGSTTTIRFSEASSAAGWAVSFSPITVTGVAVTGASKFHVLAPCRVFDTRLVGTQTTGQPLPGSDGPDSTFILTGGPCGVPANAMAVSANVTVTQPAVTGSISIYPGGSSPNETTTTSFATGQTRANNAILKLSPAGNGTVRIRNRTAGTTHVIVDVNGYFLATNTGPDEITVNLPNLPAGAKPLVLVRVPAGTFQMGSPDTERGRNADEGPLHDVTVSQEHYLGKYEVTQAQWQAVTGTGHYCSGYGDGNDYPVYCVSWNDIAGPGGFLEKLRTLTGEPRFRLPTEAEWERAARAGTRTRFSFGDALDGDDGCGASAAANPYVWWCGNNTPFGSKPVGTKAANQLGLFDMHGNVWEWVQDWYDPSYYSVSAPSDPTGPSTGSYRVVRGGGWYGTLLYTRSAYRVYGDPGVHSVSGIGFRLSRSQ